MYWNREASCIAFDINWQLVKSQNTQIDSKSRCPHLDESLCSWPCEVELTLTSAVLE